MSADLPSKNEIDRWLGEPVECIIIPSDIFIRNAANYPVLSKAHQEVISAFLQNNVHFMVKCNMNDGSIKHYSEYLKHIAASSVQKDPMKG